MEKRIREVRVANHLTQEEFGARIGVKRNTVTVYETAQRTPSDTVILSICREFNVSERWLRTGEGEMTVKRSPSEDISAFLGDVLSSEPDFRQRLLHMLSHLKAEEWRLLEKMAQELTAEEKETGP